MPIAGLVRLRKHQFGRQAVMGTKVAATRAYPFSGTPDVDLQWTDPEVDAGSLDPTAPPTRQGGEFTAPLDAPVVFYNDLPAMLAAFFGGGEVPTGGGADKTWAWAPASTTVDGTDEFTYEFGDDVTTDWFQLGDGILESLEFTGPEGLGALTAAMSWRFGSASSTGSTDAPVTGTVPTAGLSVSTTDAPVYLKDMAIYIASSTATLAANQISDALHTFTLRMSHEIDLKRYANGDQSFDIDAYGPGARVMELELSFAKTADTVGTGSEADAWFSDTAVNRWVRLTFTSTEIITGIIPYSWTLDMPMRYYTRSEGETGGNTMVVLTGHAFYDPTDLGGVLETTVVNSLASATLGSVPS
jgi:hypothetical protein